MVGTLDAGHAVFAAGRGLVTAMRDMEDAMVTDTAMYVTKVEEALVAEELLMETLADAKEAGLQW